jgi:hypothetical protein
MVTMTAVFAAAVAIILSIATSSLGHSEDL